MPAWKPIFVLPNLEMHGTIECETAAMVKCTEPRVQAIISEHPSFCTFLSKFKGQFGENVHPAVLMLKADAGDSYYTAEAVSTFRDLVALSVVPFARARRLYYLKPQSLAFSDAFAFYPWMLDKHFDDLMCFTPAIHALHLLSEFKGQSSPGHPQASLSEGDIDKPLAVALMERWHKRFSASDSQWSDRSLLRSLNMANEAARMPSAAATTYFEFGRSIAIWVSAFEILTHPGEEGNANLQTVFTALDKVNWINKKLGAETHPTGKKKTVLRTLACHVYERVYALRNDFLHGNEVSADKLSVGEHRRQMIDYAACLYRLALTGQLELTYKKPLPPKGDHTQIGEYIAGDMVFSSRQSMYERALETFPES